MVRVGPSAISGARSCPVLDLAVSTTDRCETVAWDWMLRMIALELVVLVGIALLIAGLVADRTRLPTPVLLFVLGAGLGFVPIFGTVILQPDLVLMLFLPALLYWESLNVPALELRQNARAVVLHAIPLVLLTVAAVAWVGSAFGLAVPVALVLGAVVAPTDATATAAVGGLLPSRLRTVLSGESLVNDGTALAVYGVAVAAVVSGQQTVSPIRGGVALLVAYVGGAAIGTAVGFLIGWLRLLAAERPLLENTISVLTPFLAFLPAEFAGVSGVIAVVAAGLVLGARRPRHTSARTRIQSDGFWRVTAYVLNGTLFLLVGFAAHRVVSQVGGELVPVVLAGLAVSGTVIVVRLVWVILIPYLIRALDRRPEQRRMRNPIGVRIVSGWAGFRGAVSLAAALALPTTAFPDRSAVIAVTFVVIAVTNVLQGLTLPAVIRRARLPPDPDERDTERAAYHAAFEATMAALPRAVAELHVPEGAARRVEQEYRLAQERRQLDSDEGGDLSAGPAGALRRALVATKRRTMLDLYRSGTIDDRVLRRMQAELDIEEMRVSPLQTE